MVHAVEEVEDFVAISDPLAVDIGTLSPPWVEAMRAAVARARALANHGCWIRRLRRDRLSHAGGGGIGGDEAERHSRQCQRNHEFLLGR